jgi:hypothetical protein
MKKILLVSGCSYGDKMFTSAEHPDIDCSWPKWPELLADKLDMECINLCRCGAGQEYIYNSIIDKLQTIDHSKIGLVIAAWSTAPRRDYQNGYINKSYKKYFQQNPQKKWSNDMVDSRGDMEYWIDRSLRYQYSFQTVCEHLNLPYKQIQMVHLFTGFLIQSILHKKIIAKNDPEGPYNKLTHTFDQLKFSQYVHHKDLQMTELEKEWTNKKHNELIQYIHHSPYYEKMNSNFIGWPTDKRLGGFSMNNIFNSDERISPIDWHPNQKGQIKITEYIYDRLG